MKLFWEKIINIYKALGACLGHKQQVQVVVTTWTCWALDFLSDNEDANVYLIVLLWGLN